jgi:hypothetical protein
LQIRLGSESHVRKVVQTEITMAQNSVAQLFGSLLDRDGTIAAKDIPFKKLSDAINELLKR